MDESSAFHTELPHHTSRQNHHSNTIDPPQLSGRKRNNEIPQSNTGQEIHPGVDPVISTSPASCDDEIFGVEIIEFGKGAPRDSQNPGQCSGSRSNLLLQNPRSHGCRKRLFEPGDDEEIFEPSKGDGEPNRNNNGPLTRRKCQRYACPYYLNDPNDSKYRSGEELVKCRTEGVEASKLKLVEMIRVLTSVIPFELMLKPSNSGSISEESIPNLNNAEPVGFVENVEYFVNIN